MELDRWTFSLIFFGYLKLKVHHPFCICSLTSCPLHHSWFMSDCNQAYLRTNWRKHPRCIRVLHWRIFFLKIHAGSMACFSWLRWVWMWLMDWVICPKCVRICSPPLRLNSFLLCRLLCPWVNKCWFIIKRCTKLDLNHQAPCWIWGTTQPGLAR